MAYINFIIRYYNVFFYEWTDKRTRYMFPSHIFLAIIMPLYVFFTTYLGPRLMKNRDPFHLKYVIVVYNLFQIFVNAFIIYEGFLGGWANGYNIVCQPVDYTENALSRRMINAVWWYTTVKLTDLLDTVFFVLRKKNRNISFLHVFHHSLMPVASWAELKFIPNGHATLQGHINCMVHVVMYTYYLIAGLGPKFKKYLWWKKYVTIMQLLQFSIVIVHNVVPLFLPECTFPKWINALLAIFCLQFLCLFSRFYYVSYYNKPKLPK